MKGEILDALLFFVWHTFYYGAVRKMSAMGKQEIFNKVLSLVEEETEVSRDLILSGNKQEEVVDARALLIFTLYEQGLYPAQIGCLTKICPRCINPFILNFRGRKESRRMLGVYYERVKKKLGE